MSKEYNSKQIESALKDELNYQASIRIAGDTTNSSEFDLGFIEGFKHAEKLVVTMLYEEQSPVSKLLNKLSKEVE